LVDCALFFVLHGRNIVKPGVTAIGVVPGFDIFEDGYSYLSLGPEPVPVEELAFQGGKKVLAQSIVEAIADGSRVHVPAISIWTGISV
jgi:hypothetical protein